MIRTYFPLALRLIAAAILSQTLFFKFSGAEESVWIFQQLGAEPWGRLGSGVAELVCAALLLIPRTAWLGALGGLGVMSGALVSHLFILGIEVKGDGGLLFILALVVFVCCAVTLWLRRGEMSAFVSKILRK
ncbi:MAG: DoxX family protein [Phycisphaerae bacterium]|nr:DoxX family protein [Saprospiraceae bacterium]